jgi:hypothetical protein
LAIPYCPAMADGFIRKRGDAWQVIVYAGRDPVTGRKRQLSRNVRGTKREAQAVRTRLLVEVDDGHHVSTTATFGDLVEQWFEHASPDWSPKTAAETRRLIDKIVKPRLARVRLTRLKTADLDRLYASLRKSGGHKVVRWPRPPSGGSTPSCGERCSRVSGGAGSLRTRQCTRAHRAYRARASHPPRPRT